ncbi:hypothetical protein K458DRAFT_391835 [Lentithecium fluviatile CBS 122367]|uniref:Uncharacterized protein n=1 Tax=Lentithecium fluviatile CBS 122367 TaxID=1168545 RepID=A0A6G1IUA0_9PLEO|nr:hypothetical protein K458DRAFT_391835 [Lentithecium fluviatile CBS 122367]
MAYTTRSVRQPRQSYLRPALPSMAVLQLTILPDDGSPTTNYAGSFNAVEYTGRSPHFSAGGELDPSRYGYTINDQNLRPFRRDSVEGDFGVTRFFYTICLTLPNEKVAVHPHRSSTEDEFNLHDEAIISSQSLGLRTLPDTLIAWVAAGGLSRSRARSCHLIVTIPRTESVTV